MTTPDRLSPADDSAQANRPRRNPKVDHQKQEAFQEGEISLLFLDSQLIIDKQIFLIVQYIPGFDGGNKYYTERHIDLPYLTGFGDLPAR